MPQPAGRRRRGPAASDRPIRRHAQPGGAHVAPAHFERGAPLSLRLDVLDPDVVVGATLHHRHVDQSQSWQAVPMQPGDGGLVGTIDADYTDSPYPLMYFFDIEHRDGGRALVPGLARDLSNQPYYTLAGAR